MARYYKLRLGDIWFTDDGTEDGEGCSMKVTGWNKLLFEKRGNMKRAASGKPHLNLVSTLKQGIILTLSIEQYPENLFEDVTELLNESLNDRQGFPCSIEGTGLGGAPIEFGAIAMPEDSINADGFIENMMQGVTVQIVTINLT